MACDHRTYRIHHCCLSHNHKFQINNSTDEILYSVQSTPLPLFTSLSICEASTNNKLIKISEENFHLHRRYDISAVNANDSNDKPLATVKKIHGEHHFENTFEIQSIHGVYQAKCAGAIIGHEFKLTKGNKTVVDVTKDTSFSKEGGMYNVDITDDDGGDLFLLSLVIALWHAQRLHPI